MSSLLRPSEVCVNSFILVECARDGLGRPLQFTSIRQLLLTSELLHDNYLFEPKNIKVLLLITFLDMVGRNRDKMACFSAKSG